MREIKFRAWDIQNKKMWDVFRLGCDFDLFIPTTVIVGYAEKGSAVTKPLYNLPNEKEEFILMQYTGLKDKNGKEIYEGDIVRDKTPETNWWDGVVTWHREGSVGWVAEPLLKNKHRGAWGLNYNYEYEVIGNIHESAELLA